MSYCQFILIPAAENIPQVTCTTPATTVDLINGFRCPIHPPRWVQSYAQFQRSIDRPGTADAYRRTMIAILSDRIANPPADLEQAA